MSIDSQTLHIEVWRAFDVAGETHDMTGHTVLLDRAWPSRVRKDELRVDEWARHLAPPSALHDNLRKGLMPWPEFKAAYWSHLEQTPQRLDDLVWRAQDDGLILLHGWRSPLENPAVAMRDLLLMRGRQPR